MEPNFSEMTAAVLDAYGYSEAELARQLNVSQPTIHRIKSGEVKSPSYHLGAQLLTLFENRPVPNEAA